MPVLRSPGEKFCSPAFPGNPFPQPALFVIQEIALNLILDRDITFQKPSYCFGVCDFCDFHIHYDMRSKPSGRSGEDFFLELGLKEVTEKSIGDEQFHISVEYPILVLSHFAGCPSWFKLAF